MTRHFAVLRPVFQKTGQPTPWNCPAEPSVWHRVEWTQIGTATSMEDAKRKFGGHPVLEEID